MESKRIFNLIADSDHKLNSISEKYHIKGVSSAPYGFKMTLKLEFLEKIVLFSQISDLHGCRLSLIEDTP